MSVFPGPGSFQAYHALAVQFWKRFNKLKTFEFLRPYLQAQLVKNLINNGRKCTGLDDGSLAKLPSTVLMRSASRTLLAGGRDSSLHLCKTEEIEP